jgi:predicted transcriptional regulator
MISGIALLTLVSAALVQRRDSNAEPSFGALGTRRMGRNQKEVYADMIQDAGWWTPERISSWIGLSLSKSRKLLEGLNARGLLEKRENNSVAGGFEYRTSMDLIDILVEEEGAPQSWKHHKMRIESEILGTSMTMHDEAILRMGIKGLSVNRIAVLMNESPLSVRTKLRRFGVLAGTRAKSRKFSRSKFKRLHAEGKTDIEISEILGVSRSAVQKARSELGLDPVDRSLDADSLRALHAKGLRDAEIAKALDATKTAVTRLRRELGLPTQSRVKTQISDDQLRSLHAQGLSDGEIAKQLTVSRTHVLKARKRLGLPSAKKRGGQRR